MAEETYREHKEEAGGATAAPANRVHHIGPGVQVGIGRMPMRHRAHVRIGRARPVTPAEYLAVKDDIAAVLENFKVEMRQQQERTRELVRDQHQEAKAEHEQTRAEVCATRRDVLHAIHSSPIQYLKLVSEFGSVFLLFSLVIRFALHIELVNPAFAIFMLCAFALYWGMARLKERDRRA